MSNTYYIVSKKEAVNGIVVDTQVGYFDNEQDANTLNSTFSASFTAWIQANRADLVNGTKTAAEYFSTNPPIHEASLTVNCIHGLNLNLITLNDL